MNIKFITNDYMLAWDILFQASINEEIHKIKERLWNNHKKIYSNMSNDNQLIINDMKNFIPDDDTLYNLLFNNPLFTVLKKDTEKYRQYLLKIWDDNKKKIATLIAKILRIEPKNYQLLIVNAQIDKIVVMEQENTNKTIIVWAQKKDYDNPYYFIIELIYKILETELKKKDICSSNQELVKSVLELATLNELPTLLEGKSHYLEGTSKLKTIKKQIYPYWLMYLGADKEEMLTYMMRDKIAFDVDKYVVEKKLKQLDIYSFIEFCNRNQKYIVKIDETEII